MYFIETISPEEATECVEVLSNHLQGAKEYLPNYARVFCHRPTLMAQIATLMDALRGHMDPRLWNLVNLAAARASNSSYCSLVFAHKLINRGMSQEQLLQILQGDFATVITEAELQAMHYAAKVALDASSVCREDIEALLRCGFSDAEVFDITVAAAWRCFFARVPDALGAQADQPLTELDEALVAQLIVGRPPEGDLSITRHDTAERKFSRNERRC